MKNIIIFHYNRQRQGLDRSTENYRGKAKREQDPYPDSVSKTSKEEKPCTSIKGAQREQRFFRHVLGIHAPFELPHRECHR
jgi:hypothetical protein